MHTLSTDVRELFTVVGVLQTPQAKGSMEEENRSLESFHPKHPGTIKGRIGTIPGNHGTASSFSIGMPIVHPLDGLLQAQNSIIPAEIGLQMPHYHFYWVRLACSFQAAAGYRFHMARF